MTDSTNNQSDRRVDVPASVSREGEASAAMLAEVFQSIRNQTSEQTGSRSIGSAAASDAPAPVDALTGGMLAMGDIWNQMGIAPLRNTSIAADFRPEAERSLRHEGDNRIVGNLLRGIRAQQDIRAEIRFDAQGNPNQFRDHFGTWTSTDGGNTWRIGEVKNDAGPHHVRHGRVSMEGGNLIFDNSAYGVRTTMSADRTTTRSFTATTGEQYSITQNERGHAVSFRDQHGEWTRSGEWNASGINRWRHTATGELREGRVTLGEHGGFRFETNNQGRLTLEHESRTTQLERIRNEQEQLNRRFGVTFAAPGEVRTDQGSRYVAGVPTIEELATLRSVLERSPHINFQGVRMWFAASGGEHHGHYTNSGQNHRCAGECQARGNASLNEGHMVITPRGRMFNEGMYSLEGTLLHELAHHEQGELFGQSDFNWGTGPMRSRSVQQQARELGWVFSTLRTTDAEDRNGTLHNLPGRPLLVDNHGRYWNRNGTDSDGNTLWTQVIGGRIHNGILVGGRMSELRSDTINNSRMREIASVRPATEYFIAPDEMQAEAFSAFRIDVNRPGDNRRSLFNQSRALYEVIRAQDQANLDRRLGRDLETGQSLFIRDLNGSVVRNSTETRERIRQAEQFWSAEAIASRREEERHHRHRRHSR